MPATAEADAGIQPRHPVAAHLRQVAGLGPHRPWTPDDGPLPALHLSHGAAIDGFSIGLARRSFPVP
ncbi:hypothetical protein SAMN05660657_02204 [Geodermatophilus amargosae]|uniref:Uncharacterized protein n=1 Tax=Geodermatophilus amargosae TaxID=1296565 RepID=A0A1I6ZTD6_9ACTN|nr:hypothetical protein [Geodermatophilus amargosae]SFT65887.1 hypothetical protein SAMN05660657_02204 [Geodermatophilus amargosae]